MGNRRQKRVAQAFGFRGNACNLDLNRDFVKCDSLEAKTFTDYRKIFDDSSLLKNIDAFTVSTPDHNHAIASSCRTSRAFPARALISRLATERNGTSRSPPGR